LRDGLRTELLEVKTERDTNLLNGEAFVRIRYREPGVRRWTKIAVFPDDGQPLEEVEELARDIAEMHRGR
jgi:hypothetical protein